MKTFKTVIRTLMVATIAIFFTLTFFEYKNQVISQAEASVPKKPNFEHTNNQQFLDNVLQCVDYVYHKNKDFEKVNIELLLAQAALESGWGDSRFAKVGKNLFGIRTYDLQDPHMLPSNTPKKWGVRVYEHECYSIEHYIKILNNGTNFVDYRKLRDDGIDDPMILVETLGSYASDKDYFPKIKSIIRKIRKDYNIQ
jgi:flagellum-specific peptidoglycan hydrolase FlgJ